MMENILTFKNLVISAVLIAAVYTDLRTQKVPNNLILVSAFVSVLVLVFVDGLSGFTSVLSSMGTMFIFALPLYLLRAIGGGDLKLLFVFSILASWYSIITTVFASLVWGSILGVAQAIFAGNGKVLFQNVFRIASRNKTEQTVLHKIPYTVAILFGWLTDLTLQNVGLKWI